MSNVKLIYVSIAAVRADARFFARLARRYRQDGFEFKAAGKLREAAAELRVAYAYRTAFQTSMATLKHSGRFTVPDDVVEMIDKVFK